MPSQVRQIVATYCLGNDFFRLQYNTEGRAASMDYVLSNSFGGINACLDGLRAESSVPRVILIRFGLRKLLYGPKLLDFQTHF